MLARRLRENSLTQKETEPLRGDFILHARDEYLVIELDRIILTHAARLTDAHPLRTLDAIQLACALQAVTLLTEPVTFISADVNLLNAAAAEGLIVDNPNAHP